MLFQPTVKYFSKIITFCPIVNVPEFKEIKRNPKTAVSTFCFPPPQCELVKAVTGPIIINIKIIT